MSKKKCRTNVQTITQTLARSGGLALALLLALAAVDANAQQEVRKLQIECIPATGLNDLCGEPLWKFPPPLPPDLHFTFVGAFDPAPGATDAKPLSSANCHDDTLLATTTDPDFQALNFLPDANPLAKNIPLRKVAAIAGLDGIYQPLPLMGAVPPNPLPPTKNLPDFDLKLGIWLKARGHMEIRCFHDGTAKVEADFRHLIPNALYTLNAIWLTTPPGAPGPTILPVAFAGVPSAMVASSEGRARFERDLDSCVLDASPDGSLLLNVDLGFHSSGSSYGAVPFTPLGGATFRLPDGRTFGSVLAPGITTQVQMGCPFPAVDLPR